MFPIPEIVTPDGCLHFRKMPFWMINGTVRFNKMIRKLLDNMQNTGSFVDDLLTHAQTWDKYVQLLREMFDRVSKDNLT